MFFRCIGNLIFSNCYLLILLLLLLFSYSTNLSVFTSANHYNKYSTFEVLHFSSGFCPKFSKKCANAPVNFSSKFEKVGKNLSSEDADSPTFPDSFCLYSKITDVRNIFTNVREKSPLKSVLLLKKYSPCVYSGGILIEPRRARSTF